MSHRFSGEFIPSDNHSADDICARTELRDEASSSMTSNVPRGEPHLPVVQLTHSTQRRGSDSRSARTTSRTTTSVATLHAAVREFRKCFWCRKAV